MMNRTAIVCMRGDGYEAAREAALQQAIQTFRSDPIAAVVVKGYVDGEDIYLNLARPSDIEKGDLYMGWCSISHVCVAPDVPETVLQKLLDTIRKDGRVCRPWIIRTPQGN